MPRDDQSLLKLAGDVVLADDRLRARLMAIADKMLDKIEYTLEWGTDVQQQKLLNAFVPLMMKGLAATRSDEDESKEAEAVKRLLGQLGGKDSE